MSSSTIDRSLFRGSYMSPGNPQDKMLYIFYVDIAERFTLDLKLINENILYLKQIIANKYKIPINKQVLLINGGYCLEDESKIGSYSAGTDTNPIFLFNRSFLDGNEPPFVVAEIRTNNTIDAELRYFLDTPSPMSLPTFQKIYYFAEQYLDLTEDVLKNCEEMKENQFAQHQGLMAAMANLDDVLRTFEGQFAAFDNSYIKYLENRKENIDLINRFSQDMALLAKIPLLPALLDGNEEERARLEVFCDKSPSSDISLLHWVSSKEPEHSLEDVVEKCKELLVKYDEHALVTLKKDISSLITPEKLASLRNGNEMNEKLAKLSNYLHTINTVYEEQKSKFTGIKKNFDRVVELKGDSISLLPDLIDTHRDTLEKMKANYNNMRSCRQLCLQIKKELCDIIHKKLMTVMDIQKCAAQIRSYLVLHAGWLKRLRAYIGQVQQLHSTPKNYFAAVSEVVRRRSYSQAFLMWASDLACKIHTIYSEEIEHRKKFKAQFDGHFLSCLFPGLEDMPPNFATQAPPLFDNNLPALCEDDLKVLCDRLPELKTTIQLPDVEAIRNFFLTKSLTLSEYEEDVSAMPSEPRIDELAVAMSGTGQQQDGVTMSFEDSTTVEKNDQMDRSKHENDMKTMQDGMAVLGTVAHKTVVSLKNDLSALRSWVCSHQAEIIAVVHKLYNESQRQQCHIQDLLQQIHQRENKIKSLFVKISDIETEKMEESGEEEKIEKRINEAVARERSQITKQITEELTIRHKKEMEALRQRFKLMTCANMERSPSDSSLEKIERGDIIDYAAHEAVVNQLKYDMEQQLNKAIANERYACEIKLEEELRKMNTEFENEKMLLAESIRRPLVEEFEKQLEMMKARESSLLSELQRHKEIIHTLTDHEGGNYSLLTRIDELEKEKTRLEAELIKERRHKYGYNTDSGCSSSSLTTISGCSDSPEPRIKERVVKKGASLGSHRSSHSIKNRPSVLGKISIQSCNVGDPVLVVWDEAQRNYTILQNSSTLHFLHPSSIDQLGLRPASDGSPRRLYCPAEVVEKEYCAPKKINNRYNLKEGERFYRVKVRPLANERTL